MKVKAFTIAESILVLVLSAIVFYLVMNAHQLINNMYSVYVTNGKKIESVVELDRLIEDEVFKSSRINFDGSRILFIQGDRQTVMDFEEEHVQIDYVIDDQIRNTMNIPIQMELGNAKYNNENQLTDLEVICNFDGEVHTLKYEKAYTSVQRLNWRENRNNN